MLRIWITDSKISLELLKRVFDPQTKAWAHQKPCILICDGFGTHEALEILVYYFENNIILCRLPSHTSHKLQPCDIGVFGPLKAAYRDRLNDCIEEVQIQSARTISRLSTALQGTRHSRLGTSKLGGSRPVLFPLTRTGCSEISRSHSPN